MKFLQSLDQDMYDALEKIAEKKRISVQELIRAVIIPEYAEAHKIKI